MGHGFTSSDYGVFAGKPAWHGLGRVVENAPTPLEALELARLNWNVLESAGVSGMVELPGMAEPVRMTTDEAKLVIRSDTREVLACVGKGYQPVQNAELADLAMHLAGESSDKVRVESAASIHGGRRVWFLLRGEPFALNNGKDEVHRYLLLANGHDGRLALTIAPTSVRVVCRNTLAMAIGSGRRGTLAWIKHSGDMSQKQESAKRALAQFQKAGDVFREKAEALQGKAMNREQIQSFWVDVYSALEGPIPMNPRNRQEHKARQAATDALGQWAYTFDREREVAGASAWNALNAVTHWYDHQRKVRAKDQMARNAKRLEKAILSGHVDDKLKALDMALAL